MGSPQLNSTIKSREMTREAEIEKKLHSMGIPILSGRHIVFDKEKLIIDDRLISELDINYDSNNDVLRITTHKNSETINLNVFSINLHDSYFSPKVIIDCVPDSSLCFQEIDLDKDNDIEISINKNIEFLLSSNSRVHHIYISKFNKNTNIQKNLSCNLADNATYEYSSIQRLLGHTKINSAIKLNGENAKCNFAEAVQLDEKANFSHMLIISHHASSTISNQRHNLIANGQSSGKFHGTIFAEKNIYTIEADQLSKNLLLSDDANIKSFPILEIYTDSIKCSHGSSVGMINENQLAYLMARGIEKKLAINMIIEGLLNDILSQENNPLLRSLLN